MVVEQGQIEIFDEGTLLGSTSRDDPGPFVDVGVGELDGNPGEDLLFFDPQGVAHLYGSNGVDGFTASVAQPSPLEGATRLLVAQLDGNGLYERLYWGPTGATLQRGENEPLLLLPDPVIQAAAIAAGPEGTSILLLGEDYASRFTLEGEITGQPYVNPSWPLLMAEAERSYLSLATQDTWAMLEAREALEYSWSWWDIDRHLVTAPLTRVVIADFDGDERSDLAGVTAEGQLKLVFALGRDSACIRDASFESVDELALAPMEVGDVDGDGDDELALFAEGALDEVLLVEIE